MTLLHSLGAALAALALAMLPALASAARLPREHRAPATVSTPPVTQPQHAQRDTSREARREAMRQAAIPTSQQPERQIHTPAGRQLHYSVPGPVGTRRAMVVTHQTTDRVPGHGAHWEAGAAKLPQRSDPLGRTRVSNDKRKVTHVR